MSIPTPSEFLASLFASGHQADAGEAVIGPAGPGGAGVTLGAAASPEVEVEISL